jgi:VirE N-terminal domain/Primase C terminal 2 (PriCT-2)
MKVSFYKNIADTTSKEVVTIPAFLKAITNGKYKKIIETLRQAQDKETQRNLKKQLPNITASGTFTKRVDSSLIAHSGLKQIDIDKDGNEDLDALKAKEQLIKDKHTFAAFISPTGTGVKLLVQVNPNEEKTVYSHLKAYYSEKYKLNIDTSCSNVSRAMFVSHDEELYQNPKSEIFAIPKTDSKNALPGIHKANPLNDKAKEVELLIKKIEASKTDITGDYHQWLKIGFALASEFGSNGESYYHRISCFSKTYDAAGCTNQFKECCKQRKPGIGINTLFAIAKECNILVHEPAQSQISKAKGLQVNKPGAKINSEEIVFYSAVFKTDDEGKQVLKDIKINYVKFIELLYSFGFRRFDIDNNFIYIHLKETVIKEVTVLQVQDYFFNYLETLPEQLSGGITKKNLKEKIYNNPKNYFCDNRLSLLINKQQIVFNTDTKTECFIYYKNGFVQCKKDGWQLNSYDKLNGHIWENQIIDREFTYCDVQDTPNEGMSVYAQFLLNVSGKDEVRYHSLCSLIGYLLHSYTDVKMKAVILTDSRISEEANGRTGKTLFGQTLRHIKKLTQINGKDFDFTNRYKYQEANLDTQIVFLNDVRSNFRFETLYNDITEGITVEKKNQNPFTLKIKMCITTNKTIAIEGSSSKDRCIEFEFANHYNENYSPEDEFKQRFFSDWDKKGWQQFDNFMMHCICVYLGNGIIQAQGINLKQRKLLDQTDKYFIEFMNDKIKCGEIVAGKEILKQELHRQFLNEYPELQDDKYRKRLETFTKWIKTFARYSPHFDEQITERKSMSNRYFTFTVKQ